jgi:hypothetical protein
VAAGEGNTAIIREARAAKPICRCLPRHPRAAALQRPGGGRGAGDARCPWGTLGGPEPVHRAVCRLRTTACQLCPQFRVYCCIAVSEAVGQGTLMSPVKR